LRNAASGLAETVAITANKRVLKRIFIVVGGRIVLLGDFFCALEVSMEEVRVLREGGGGVNSHFFFSSFDFFVFLQLSCVRLVAVNLKIHLFFKNQVF